MTSRGHPERIVARDNPVLRLLRLLTSHGTEYRRQGRCWVEGEHLCGAAVQRGIAPQVLVVAESAQQRVPEAWWRVARRAVVVDDDVFQGLGTLESPARVGCILEMPAPSRPRSDLPTVVLDRVQDAGNVGSILRSAAAFGFRQVLAVRGTAGLWSPKVVRAGMGAHFGLTLVETLDAQDIVSLGLPLVVTSSHAGIALPQAHLPAPCAWVFGHEGQGVSDALASAARMVVCIPQPGGEESLNVAAAAAICFYASHVGDAPRGGQRDEVAGYNEGLS